MKKPEFSGNEWIVHNSDCIEGMNAMPANSVDCAIFSPPFGDLFVYSDSERDLGNSGAGVDFQEHYGFFARALTRVIRPGRIVCVHCSDMPMRKGKDGAIGLKDFSGDLIRAHTDAGLVYHGRATIWKDPVVEMQRTKALGLLYKQIRKDSTMNRPGMPDYMLFFRKDDPNDRPISHGPIDTEESINVAKEWLGDLRKMGMCSQIPDDKLLAELVRESEFGVDEWQQLASPVWMDIKQGNVLRKMKSDGDEKHVCPLQLDVIRRCLRLWSRPGDVILDPFNGIGSTGYESVMARRKYVGFELKAEYAVQAGRNIKEAEDFGADLFAAV